MLKKVGYIAIFYAIAILIRFYLVKVQPDFIANLNPIVIGLLSGISPLIGALVMIYVFKRKINYRLFSVGKLTSIALVLLPIILFTVAGYLENGVVTYILPVLIASFILYGFLEEFGWRGYLQSELSDIKPIYKYLIISVLWYPWHLDFGLDMAHLYSYIFVLAGSIGMGYVADKSKSLILPALFHAFSNLMFSSVSFGSQVQVSFMATLVIVIVCIVAIIAVMIKTGRDKRIYDSKTI